MLLSYGQVASLHCSLLFPAETGVWGGWAVSVSERKAQVWGSSGAVWSGNTTSWLGDLTMLEYNFLFHLKNEEIILHPTHPLLRVSPSPCLSSSMSLHLCHLLSLCFLLSLTCSLCFSGDTHLARSSDCVSREGRQGAGPCTIPKKRQECPSCW